MCARDQLFDNTDTSNFIRGCSERQSSNKPTLWILFQNSEKTRQELRWTRYNQIQISMFMIVRHMTRICLHVWHLKHGDYEQTLFRYKLCSNFKNKVRPLFSDGLNILSAHLILSFLLANAKARRFEWHFSEQLSNLAQDMSSSIFVFMHITFWGISPLVYF